MPEIQSLTLRVRELSQSVDFWNLVMLWALGLAALAAVAVGITTRIVITHSGQLSKAQELLSEAKDRQLQGDLKQKEVEVVGLQKDASDAKAAQQRVETELEKQRERTAKAEETLLAVTNRQGNRYVKNNLVATALKGKPTGTVIIWYEPNDPEAYWFAHSILGELLASNWKVPTLEPVPEKISSVAFLPPEFQLYSEALERFDRTRPPTVRIAGGNAELTLLSKTPDNGDPKSLVTILTGALKPLVFRNWGWNRADKLPDDTFILIVGPKP